ncbi:MULTISPECIES: helix-turn-helix domain-containing protein [Streptomyces]|uniref:Helix-turn-helix domain-containing protein n=1 Tax=Streptomyces sudanensis TaxID=436397 RepID=A0ABY4TFP9_9ACTN|nr:MULTISPECIES: helix-turn-helix transcriptional regulator [Streptomyces]URN16396.1 helix-turn-helix domain-containing protein [Streptomyces sudanensis]
MMTPDGIGALLRGVRERAGRTREEQARRMEEAGGGRFFDPENLKRWETERRLPTPVFHETIARAYGVTVAEVRRAVAASRQARRHGKGGTSDVDRRRFMGAAAAVGAAGLPGIAQAREAIDGALVATPDGDLTYLESAYERYRGGYRGRSPDALLTEMRADLDLLRHTLARPHSTRARARLVRTTAGLAGLVAIIQHDRGDQPDAARWFSTAERAARESGDRRVTAWVLARHAMVGVNYGAPRQAAVLAAKARRAAGSAPTAAAALAAAVSARALAALGDRSGARAAVEDARSFADRLDGDETADTWTGYPAQKHLVHLSQAYTLLGDTRAAYEAQEQALALTGGGSVMTRALLTLDRAMCLCADGDPSLAASTAADVLERLPTAYRGGLVGSRAVVLHRRLTGRPRDRLGQFLAGS